MEKILQNIPELSNLSKQDIKKLAAVSTLLNCKKDDVLFRVNEKASHAWFLVSGKIVMGNSSPTGNQSASCILRSGEMFCCLPIMDAGPYTATAVCSEKSSVLRIPLAEFNDAISKDPLTHKKFIANFCSRIREVECRLCNQAEPAADKISIVLKQHYAKFGKEFDLTRSEIAQLTGLTVETVIRTLSAMKKKNIIGGSRGKIVVLKLEAL